MIQLSFPTNKLKSFIRRVNLKVKDTSYKKEDLIVYGVTNKEGITITGNQASEDLSNYLILKENQFAYNPYRINVGSLGLAPQGVIGAVSPAYVVFETTSELNSMFLYYYLKSQLGINLIKWYGDRGGVRSALRYADLEQIDIPKLTLQEQLNALESIKTLSEYLDQLDENLEIQQEKIYRLRQSILQEAVQGKLVPQDSNDEPASILLEKIKSKKEQQLREKKIKKAHSLPLVKEEEIPYELPHGWEWVRLGEITEFVGGFAFKSDSYVEYSDNQIVRLGNVKNDKLLLNSNPAYIPDDIASVNEPYRIKEKDILVTMTGTRGKRDYFYTCLIDESLSNKKLYLNQRVGCLRCFENLHADLICLFLKSNVVLDMIFETETGTANQGNIGASSISSKIIFPLPPYNEQKRIVERVDQLMTLCDELMRTVLLSKQESEMLVQAVMQEAFSTSERENNIIEFPNSTLNEIENEWDMVARANEISPDTQAEIANLLIEIKREGQ